MKQLACIAAVFATVSIGTLMPTPVGADGSYVTGTDWTSSSRDEKLSYVMGISNLMSADYELQRKGGRAGGSAITELYNATANVTLNQAVAVIDNWYSTNPDKLDETVLDVIWLTLVER